MILWTEEFFEKIIGSRTAGGWGIKRIDKGFRTIDNYNKGKVMANTEKKNDMEHRKLGEMDVSAIGLGCLPMVGFTEANTKRKI